MVPRKPVITAQICGGLGNQLFSYAAGRALAVRNDAILKLDTHSGFVDDVYQREYLLHQFDIQAEAGTPWECGYGAYGYVKRKCLRLLDRFRTKEKAYLWSEADYERVDKRLFENPIRRDIYLSGYWHSEQYFADVAAIIRDEFKITAPLSHDTLETCGRLRTMENPVCLGVRIYQEVKEKNSIHKCSNADYYHRAMDLLASRVDNPTFIVFCNDIEWVQRNLTFKHPKYIVEPKTENLRAYEDLHIMTQCKHFIISNSSYYWWGAWLGQGYYSLVVAPVNSFYNKDAIPDRWLKL